MGTLNLFLKMPEKIQKSKNESDLPGLKQRVKKANFNYGKRVLDVFSA